MRLLGKPPDFDKSVRPELPTLYRVARRMLKSTEDAEDLVQQTLLNAYKAWSRFNGKYLRSWLISIMRNERANRLRYEASRPQTEELDFDAPEKAGLWDRLEWRDQAHRLFEEMDALPEEFRLTVQLCDVDQLSYEEAAEAMGVPVGTVRSRLFRARNLLRKRLAEFKPVEETL